MYLHGKVAISWRAKAADGQYQPVRQRRCTGGFRLIAVIQSGGRADCSDPVADIHARTKMKLAAPISLVKVPHFSAWRPGYRA
jgi:hypothetical protein